MLKKKSIVAGERVSYRPGAGKRKKASTPHPKQYGIVEGADARELYLPRPPPVARELDKSFDKSCDKDSHNFLLGFLVERY